MRYGATISQGDGVYSDLTDAGDYKLTDADALATSLGAGIAITPGVDGDYGFIVTEGDVDVGGVLVVGKLYGISVNPGKIAPESDLASGDFSHTWGYAVAADTLRISKNTCGVAKA